MSNKLVNYYYREEHIEANVLGRFGATLKNLEEIKEHPIIGRGLIAQTRYKDEDILLKTGINKRIFVRWDLICQIFNRYI